MKKNWAWILLLIISGFSWIINPPNFTWNWFVFIVAFVILLLLQKVLAIIQILRKDPIGFIDSILISPFIEELIFRNLCLFYLAQTLMIPNGQLIATLIISIIFAIFHFSIDENINPTLFFDYFIHGMLFGLIYLYTSSFAMTLVLHMIANLFIYLKIGYRFGFRQL